MPFAIAIKKDGNLHKIVKVFDEPGLTIEDVYHKRNEWCIEHNVPVNDTIIVYSD